MKRPSGGHRGLGPTGRRHWAPGNPAAGMTAGRRSGRKPPSRPRDIRRAWNGPTPKGGRSPASSGRRRSGGSDRGATVKAVARREPTQRARAVLWPDEPNGARRAAAGQRRVRRQARDGGEGRRNVRRTRQRPATRGALACLPMRRPAVHAERSRRLQWTVKDVTRLGGTSTGGPSG